MTKVKEVKPVKRMLTTAEKTALGLAAVVNKLSPEELKDPSNLTTLYLLAGLDEILCSNNLHEIPTRVWEALRDIARELDKDGYARVNLKKVYALAHGAIDSIECALGPRENEDEGAALNRLRRLEDQIATRRKND
jgi:hypothetical protein